MLFLFILSFGLNGRCVQIAVLIGKDERMTADLGY